ncbi:hypothetical protein IQ260_21265 [Leptolyngbya cf. ectocarpi LEGE 11479]|uniref:Apple domain-containing protein n=1 Tax=Leptolyngbya cf. ectocarpi LEGE 11479 TaxID=1828722 RepID=A0A928ZXD0_LEPEC|nr:PAN domain-containing protein [Leptolyngbya ectocarpi]MBE9069179.1 hypothetical protein [Leptolyngbya cf. ectocarpi LEGE 11479]
MGNAPVAGPRFVIDFEVDQNGHDYDHFAATQMEDCLKACVGDCNCNAFTYAGRGYQPNVFDNRKSLCWLKD